MVEMKECPLPKKAIYRSKKDAWRDIKGESSREAPADYQIRPYKCQCGKWHVTSKKLILLRKRRENRSWTIVVDINKGIIIKLGGPHGRPVGLELNRVDALVFAWALVRAVFRLGKPII